MAPPFTSRPPRVYRFTPAAGAHVAISQYDEFDLVEPSSTIFDINLGILTETFKNQNVTNSGDNGGENWGRVGGAWGFRLAMHLPAKLINEELRVAFVQQLLGSSRNVAMRFFMGDPTFWTDQGLQVRSFVGGRALLGEVVVRSNVLDHQMIDVNVAGVGIGLLLAFLDNDLVYP